MQDQIRQWLDDSLATLRRQGLDLPEVVPQVNHTKTTAHGDYTSNIALILASRVDVSAPELAGRIIAELPASEYLNKAEVAGSGFINFYLNNNTGASLIDTIISADDHYGSGYSQPAKKILLEYVSANPTGPLHIGHGRGAAYGETIATLLKAAGHQVECEYYVNDAGRQMDILLLSAWFRYLELGGLTLPFPQNAYQGDYIWDLAAQIRNERADDLKYPVEQVLRDTAMDETQETDQEKYLSALITNCRKLLGEKDYAYIHKTALNMILGNIKLDLDQFGVRYDNWFSERSLFAGEHIAEAVDLLRGNGHVYNEAGALWYRSTTFGDDKDRVLQKSNGEFTYFASDIAYHLNKYRRGYDLMINIWGADHHGYVARLNAAIRAMGLDTEKLVIILVQFANLYRGKQKIPMSTRAGEFVTLKSLYQEVGTDAARFFYIMRKPSQHLDFDIDLAKTDSADNPVYYVQYAHARICSVFKRLQERNLNFEYRQSSFNVERLNEPEERSLIKLLDDYQTTLRIASDKLEPHVLLNFIREIATRFHSYYNRCQFLVDDRELRDTRLSLLTAVRIVIRNGLRLFGVSAPESM